MEATRLPMEMWKMHGRETLRKLHWQENKNERQVHEGPERLERVFELAKIKTCPLRHNIIKQTVSKSILGLIILVNCTPNSGKLLT
jgi:hypothetical protein